MKKDTPTNKAKVTAWSGDLRLSFDGTISACALELFHMIQDPEVRARILRLMQAHHEEQIAEGR